MAGTRHGIKSHISSSDSPHGTLSAPHVARQSCMKHTRALLQIGHRRCVGRGLDCTTSSQPRQTAWRKRGLRAFPQAHRPGGERESSSGVGRSEEKSSKQIGHAVSGFSGESKPSAAAKAATRSPHALRRCVSYPARYSPALARASHRPRRAHRRSRWRL